MSQSLHMLSYFSKSNLQGNKAEITEGIKQILDVSKKNNKPLGVTGALLFSGGYFVQILEGPQDSVEQVYEKISQDKRHHDVLLISSKAIDERRFENWSMALATVNPDGMPELEALLKKPEDIKGSQTGMVLVEMFTDLLNNYEE